MSEGNLSHQRPSADVTPPNETQLLVEQTAKALPPNTQTCTPLSTLSSINTPKYKTRELNGLSSSENVHALNIHTVGVTPTDDFPTDKPQQNDQTSYIKLLKPKSHDEKPQNHELSVDLAANNTDPRIPFLSKPITTQPTLAANNTDPRMPLLSTPITTQPTLSGNATGDGSYLTKCTTYKERSPTTAKTSNDDNNNHIPSGLQYLAELDQVLIKQQTALLEVAIGWECSNAYNIFNSVGQQCFYAMEESSCCNRQLCGLHRSFDIHITDLAGADIFLVKRPCLLNPCPGLQCLACCGLCQDKVRVEDPSGYVYGLIHQACSCIRPHYIISDENFESKYEIWGPCCTFTCCGRLVNFPIYEMSTGREIACIRKMFSGYIKEAFTDSDNFGVSFPLDMDPKDKAVLIGAVFLIDFMYFETKES